MTTNFPSSIDAFTNPTSADTLDNPPHDQQHADINDAMEAVQTSLLDGAPLYIDDANERVGIGTQTPRTPLEIQGTSSGSVDEVLLLAADGNQVAGSGARLHLSGGNATQRSAYVEGVNTSGSTNAHDLTFGTSAGGSDPVERMRITASGDVGIGTTTPDRALTVAGGETTIANFTSTSATSSISFVGSGTTNDTSVRVGAVGDQMKLFAGDAERVRIDASGNVGINKTAPGVALDVVGSSTTGDSVLRVKSNDVRTNIVMQDTTTTSDILLSCYGNDFYVRTGGADRLHVDSSGRVRAPNQPAFFAYLSGSNPTYGTGWTSAIHNATLFNVGSGYSTSQKRFNAPVSGRYLFIVTVSFYNYDRDTRFIVHMDKNGSGYSRVMDFSPNSATSTDESQTGSVIMDLAAGNYVFPSFNSTDSNWQMSAGSLYNSFQGYLIG